jgi:hypothetical protein
MPIVTRVIDRPVGGGVSTVSFPVLPVGTLQVMAQAIAPPGPNDWDRFVLASGTAPLIIVAGQNTNTTLTLTSNIDTIAASASIMRLVIGNSASVTLTALDAQNNPLLLSQGRIVWETSAPGTVNVSAHPLLPFTYNVNAVAAGNITLWARDTESNKISSSITVVTAATTILPTSADIVGTWIFSDGSSLTMAPTTFVVDLYPITYEPGFEITPDAVTHPAGIVNGVLAGAYNAWPDANTTLTGTATLTFSWAEDNSLTVEAVGTNPMNSLTLTGGVKQ